MRELVLSVIDAHVTFGGKPLFEKLSFNIHEGDKICLVGRNGAGKTTLMQLITGTRELDGGKRWQVPGTKIGYLPQEVKIAATGQRVYDYIFEGLSEEQRTDDYRYRVDVVMEPLELHADDTMDKLSGGQLRRAALARALVEEPEILLLDEPTNHLDLGGIEWLENFLNGYRGTVLCVSHDKQFLKNISNKIFWLDRGNVRVCPRGFEHFEEWSEMLLEHERQELANRAKTVELEVEWAMQGVKARRKRNIRRLEQMKEAREKLKQDQARYRHAIKKIEIAPIEGVLTTNVVAEFFNVHKNFYNDTSPRSRGEAGGGHPGPGPHPNPPPQAGEGKKILEKFGLRIIKGDRIGVLGRNGSGKTTFLRLLLGELTPDTGKVKISKELQVSYFDQKRRELKDSQTLWKTLVPSGGDYVDVMGKPRHVRGYLKDFMFDPKSAMDKVGTLSGGQKNRLMLAKVLANPGNLLILDEPTNDLDMDTLDMLEELLSKFKGTLFVVSHDRDFLDQTVTKILAFEGNAKVEECIGGYSDYLAWKRGVEPEEQSARGKEQSAGSKEQGEKKAMGNSPAPRALHPTPSATLTNPERYELKRLPGKIEKLEHELGELHVKLADPAFYEKERDAFFEISNRAARAQEELETLETRWLELEEKRGDAVI